MSCVPARELTQRLRTPYDGGAGTEERGQDFMVGEEVRQVEAEIDRCIQEMPVWCVKRAVLLRRLVTIWRDGLELMHLMAAHAAMFQVEEGLKTSIGNEHLMLTGVYQGLKWAMEFAHDDALKKFPTKSS